MADHHMCPQCGSALPVDAPDGLCAACLMRAGFMDDEPTEFSPGKFQPPTPAELAGRFPQLEIYELLGHGGMGAVYRARQKALDRVVALKIMPPQSATDAAFAERFAREARAMARLHHSNIVTVFEFGEADGLFYLVMEYVEGVNLRQAIRSRQITAEQALAIVPQICDALQYAHEEGVVHRDIKPENILLDKRGRVKIADFGLAKLLRRTDADITLTVTRQVVGTFHYMAPEQIEKPLQVDHRADIYSLGVVFYELLTGDLPVGRFKLPSERAAIDARLDDVVLKTLEREPSARYQHASELKSDVQSISSSPQHVVPPMQVAAEPVPRSEHSAPSDTAAPGIVMMILGIFTLLGSVLGMYFGLGFGSPPAETPFVQLVRIIGLPSMLAGALMIIGGISLQRDLSYGWSMAGIVAGLLPIAGSWPLTAPVSIWALLALRRSAERDAFGDASKKAPRKLTEEEVEDARQHAGAPGIGLIIVGIIDLAIIGAVLMLFVSKTTIERVPSSVTPTTNAVDEIAVVDSREATSVTAWALVFSGALLLIQFPTAVLLIIAGISIARLRSRALGIIGSIAAMLPLHVACILGFPVGLWSLVTLMREDVRAAFTTRRRRPVAISHFDYASPSELSAPRSAASIWKTVVMIVLAILLVLGLLLSLIIGTWWAMPM